MYALHVYFLIGLRWLSGNNRRAVGVTSDNSEAQGGPGGTKEQERNKF